MAPKRRLSRGADLNTMGRDFVSRAANQALDDAIQQLTTNPKYAQPVLQFLETLRNPVAEEATALDCLHPATNKFRLLSQKDLKAILAQLSPENGDRIMAVKGKSLHLLLCFAIHHDCNSAVFSKHKPTLEDQIRQAYQASGSRLRAITWGGPDGVDWSASGYFRIVRGDANVPVTLRYAGGGEVPWPQNLAQVDAEWHVDDNANYARAKVVGGMIAVSCTLIFQEAGVALQPPAMLVKVPGTAAPMTPVAGAPAVAASPASSSAASS